MYTNMSREGRHMSHANYSNAKQRLSILVRPPPSSSSRQLHQSYWQQFLFGSVPATNLAA
jgi:hypothetical protein